MSIEHYQKENARLTWKVVLTNVNKKKKEEAYELHNNTLKTKITEQTQSLQRCQQRLEACDDSIRATIDKKNEADKARNECQADLGNCASTLSFCEDARNDLIDVTEEKVKELNECNKKNERLAQRLQQRNSNMDVSRDSKNLRESELVREIRTVSKRLHATGISGPILTETLHAIGEEYFALQNPTLITGPCVLYMTAWHRPIICRMAAILETIPATPETVVRLPLNNYPVPPVALVNEFKQLLNLSIPDSSFSQLAQCNKKLQKSLRADDSRSFKQDILDSEAADSVVPIAAPSRLQRVCTLRNVTFAIFACAAPAALHALHTWHDANMHNMDVLEEGFTAMCDWTTSDPAILPTLNAYFAVSQYNSSVFTETRATASVTAGFFECYYEARTVYSPKETHTPSPTDSFPSINETPNSPVAVVPYIPPPNESPLSPWLREKVYALDDPYDHLMGKHGSTDTLTRNCGSDLVSYHTQKKPLKESLLYAIYNFLASFLPGSENVSTRMPTCALSGGDGDRYKTVLNSMLHEMTQTRF
ncbi:hypothetical protein CYMTET_44346 [Cymbomonas tetramitiformis]|uniref:Uncharacterized protein n=1 Tax=Cymbomonas tetramitiformis TaxID=36881 RepID=A0AAE0C233_9CHLO|nr:hypothetical protein CYMTET_44346 [Cymbomonas tetramitiformis]